MNGSGYTEVLEAAIEWLSRTNLAAGILILSYLGLSSCAGKFIAPRWRAVFGVVVAARLLLPTWIESSFSIFNLADSLRRAPVSSNAGEMAPAWMETLSEAPVAAVSEISVRARAVMTDQTTHLSSGSGFFSMVSMGVVLAWIGGASVLLGSFVYRYVCLALWVSRQQETRDTGLKLQLANGRRVLDIRGPVRIVVNNRFETAAVFGFFKPVVLLPADFSRRFTSEERWSIMLHELAHIRRHDVFWNWVAAFAQSLHWFNPLVWLAMRRFKSDREMACDSMVVSVLPDSQRRSYGDALLKTAQTVIAARFSPALAPFGSRNSELRERILMIASPAGSRLVVHLVVITLLGLLCGTTFTAAVTGSGDRGESVSSEESNIGVAGDPEDEGRILAGILDTGRQEIEVQIGHLLDASRSLSRLGLNKDAGRYRDKARLMIERLEGRR